MNLIEVLRLYRRAILIYIVAIVVPACGVLWLGVESFERQRQALATLKIEKLNSAQEAEIQKAAEQSLSRHDGPIAKVFFIIDNGTVVRPALNSPVRAPLPEEFTEAEHQELDLNRPDLALESLQKLAAAHQHEALALSFIARCLEKLGREDQARAEWRKLAALFPDERDLSHRPFGIIASINAGDTAGLYDRISSGRWELSADQAEYFLSKLDAKRSSPYLDQFQFARELADHFRPSGTSGPHELQSYSFTGYRVFYREARDGRFEGFVVDQEWVTRTLRPRLERELGLSNIGGLDLGVYGGAMATVLLLLSGVAVLLMRDLSREARANRLRADLVSSVSHELKTPITLIRLYGETMLDRAGLSAEERREFCHIIVRESERLTRLVNQVLTFSRIERGAQVYTLTEGDLGSAIKEIVNDYQEYLERRGFTIAQSLGESAPAVRFDETALSQAVLNLLDNAAKYSGSSREIAVRLRAGEGSVIFEVEDHGVGIPAAERDKIFDRFYRVSNGSGKGGYGLGLFLVRHIMDAHGGRAEVQSEPGRGSSFRLVFPAVN